VTTCAYSTVRADHGSIEMQSAGGLRAGGRRAGDGQRAKVPREAKGSFVRRSGRARHVENASAGRQPQSLAEYPRPTAAVCVLIAQLGRNWK
jgi:hypothetical protein